MFRRGRSVVLDDKTVKSSPLAMSVTENATRGLASGVDLKILPELLWDELGRSIPGSLKRRPDGRYPLLISAIFLMFGLMCFLALGHHRFGEGMSPNEIGTLTREVDRLGITSLGIALVSGTIGYFIRAISFVGATPTSPRSGDNAPNP